MNERGPRQVPYKAFTLVVISFSLGLALAIGVYYFGVDRVIAEPQVTVTSTAISADGSGCVVEMKNSGSAAAALSSLKITYRTPAGAQESAISFAPAGLSIQAGDAMSYQCSFPGQAQFMPVINGEVGGAYSVSAYFQRGIQASSDGLFQ